MSKVSIFESYRLVWAVYTDLPADRYKDRPLPGGTTDWGCFRPVTIGNQPVTNKMEKKREKKRENLEKRCCSPDPDPSLVGRIFNDCGEKKTTCRLLTELL
ncbi:hypothetical protein GW17_00038904 [Ensete ventricosum]|nr:hypothetical protein GW17_00038904 [Ensete ventricosum]